MGLLSSLNAAVSGLTVNQKNLSILSQNIANANTPNYSREIANQSAVFTDGQPQGVTISNVARSIDDFLSAEVRSQTSINNSATTVQSFYSQIQNLLGQPGSDSTLDQSINSFFTALQGLANSPSISGLATVVNTGTTLASRISGLANSLQGLRLQADTQIASAAKSVNADLLSLQTVNNALEHAAATNQDTAGLLDQRDKVLGDIAQYLDVQPLFDEAGRVSINTTNGISLISANFVSQLSYTPASSAQTFIHDGSLGALQVSTLGSNGRTTGSPQILASAGISTNVTTSLVSGKIQGLLSMRDHILPNILSQLDQLAANVRDQINTVHNSGTGFPPPNSYTGTRLVQGDSITQYSGSVRIAVLGSGGAPITSPYADEPNGMPPLTLDLSTLDTGDGAGLDSIDGIINAINQYYGSPQNKVELGNLNNVQLSLISNNLPNTANTLGFNFNLSNISQKSANFVVTGVTVLDSTGATVDASPATAIPNVALATTNTYQTNGTNTVTVTTATASGYSAGQTIYLDAPPGGTVTGLASSALGGFFTVQSVTGTTITITVPGASEATAGAYDAGSGLNASSNTASVDSGQTLNTGANDTFTADLTGHTASPFYTVQASIATIDSDGNTVTSTVSYRVSNNISSTKNDLIGAFSATGDGNIIRPSTVQALATATLVDANGKPLIKTNGSYGTQQGYLKISAGLSTYTVAIDQLDSQEIGRPDQSPPQAGTNQGFSQYFGLNNFFSSNALTTTGDTVKNSAINFAVDSRIAANPGLISVGKLAASNQPNPAQPSNFTYQVYSGDNSISQQLAGLANNLFSFSASGGLPASNTTLSQYAGQLIAVTSTNSVNATNTVNDSQTLLSGFTERAQSISGVNLDQELANTIIYQNAYSASTRIITVVSKLLDDLLNSVP